VAENHRTGSNPLSSRREMLGMSGKAALAGIAAGTGFACCGQTASYRLCRHLLGCSRITCGLDHQAVVRLLVERRPYSFAGGGCVRLHPSASRKWIGSESVQIERHSDL
jgi:hypothetical protein